MTKRTSLLFLIALFSIIIVVGTLYLPKTISNINELNHISCGWPLNVIEFSSQANPPLPFTKSCSSWFMGSPMDWNGEFIWIPFLLNLLIFFVILRGLFYLKQKIFKSGNLKS